MNDTFFADAFAGCGGFSTGAVAAGLKPSCAIDFYKPAVETYIFNLGNHLVNGDVNKNDIYQEFIDKSIKNENVTLIGSPPCQGFSLSGMRNIIDERNSLVTKYFKMIKDIQPKAFLMENVVGIMSSGIPMMKNDEIHEYFKVKEEISRLSYKIRHKKCHDDTNERYMKLLTFIDTKYKDFDPNKYVIPTCQFIRETTKKLGYSVKMKVLNAVDYGVPQNRKRFFVFGIKESERKQPFFPLPDHFKQPEKALFGVQNKKFITARQAIGDLENNDENIEFNHVFTQHDPQFIERLKKIEIGKSLYDHFKQSYRKLNPYEPSLTVTENHGTVFVHWKKESRLLTPRELARLQTFPDSFLFKGTKSEILKMIGNAVPPVLSCKILLNVVKILCE